MIKQLYVHLHGRLTGFLRDIGNARVEFQYSDDYLKDKPLPLSISLPITSTPFEDSHCRAFFSGLLPDDLELERLARHLQISRQNIFKLLLAVGGECAGAVSMYPDTPPPEFDNNSNQKEVSEINLEKLLTTTSGIPMTGLGEDHVRLSLAGAQAKLALRMSGGRMYFSTPNKASTHIFKPPSKLVDELVQNEYYCMQLAAVVGINVPSTDIQIIGNTPVFQINRYDRELIKDEVIRLHQEDFCQALNIVPENKYQAEGGPSIDDCIQLLLSHSIQPAQDYLELLDRIIFNYIIGNNDAHAKNFSLMHLGSQVRLAPAYDLVCTVIYPDLASKMAMKIGSKYKPDDVQIRDWNTLVKDTKAARNLLRIRQQKLCENIKKILSSENFNDSVGKKSGSIGAKIAIVILERIKILESQNLS